MDFFGSPLSVNQTWDVYKAVAPVQLPSGQIVENPTLTALKQQQQASTIPVAKSKTILYVMVGFAVVMACVLIFLILKRK